MAQFNHKLAVVVCCMLLSSCIAVHHNEADSFDVTGAIRPGVTTELWVQQNLGEPVSRHSRLNGNKIWHYGYDKEERETSVNIFLLFSFHGRETYTSDVYIEIQDGLVVDYWAD